MDVCLFICLCIFSSCCLQTPFPPSTPQVRSLSTMFVTQHNTSGRFLNTHHPKHFQFSQHCTSLFILYYFISPIILWGWNYYTDSTSQETVLEKVRWLAQSHTATQKQWRQDLSLCLSGSESSLPTCSGPQCRAPRGAWRAQEKYNLQCCFFSSFTDFKHQPCDSLVDKYSLAHHLFIQETTLGPAVGTLLSHGARETNTVPPCPTLGGCADRAGWAGHSFLRFPCRCREEHTLLTPPVSIFPGTWLSSRG